ncbi:unnamed protein product [Brassica oleracea]
MHALFQATRSLQFKPPRPVCFRPYCIISLLYVGFLFILSV